MHTVARLIVGILLLLGSPSLAQDVEMSMHHAHMTYGVADGLPQSSVYAIARDAAGYTWVGTEYGLGYFDGHSWQECPASASMGLIYDLAPAADGSLWVASELLGLIRLYPVPGVPDHLWEMHAVELPAGVTAVYTLALDTTEVLYAGTDNGLYRRDGNRWERVHEDLDGLSVFDIQVLTDGIFLATNGGAFWLEGSNIHAWELPDVANTVYRDARGRRWVGTEDGLYRLKEPGTYEGVPEITGAVNALTGNAMGHVWAGTRDGLRVYVGETWYVVPSIRDRRLYPVLSLALQDNALLVGTINAGLAVLRRTGWHHLRTIDHEPLRAVTAIAQDATGAFWMSTSSGLYRFASGRWQSVPGAPRDPFPAIMTTADGSVWMGRNDRIWRYREGTWTSYPTPGEETEVQVNRFIEDGGRLVGASSEGLWVWDGQRWSRIRTGDPRIDRGELTDIVVEAPGRWIVGTRGTGLYRVAPGGAVVALLDTFATPYQDIITLHRCAATGHLIVATIGGVLLWDGKRWYTPEDYGVLFPQMREPVYSIEEDAQRYHYFGTRRGIYRISNRLSEHLHAGRRVPVMHFVEEDGLSALETNAGASFRDGEGRFWFGTVQGVSVYDATEPLPAEPVRPVLRVFHAEGLPEDDWVAFMRAYRKALVNGTDMPVLVLPPDAREALSFSVGTVSLIGQYGLHYRIWLEGFDGIPGGWLVQDQVLYRRLPPGHFVLRTQIQDRLGQVGPPLHFEVVALPAFWERSWVRMAGLFMLVSVLVLLFGWWSHAEARKQQQEQELRRIREAAEWHAFHTRILESVPGMVFVLDPAGKVIQMNPRAADLLTVAGAGEVSELLACMPEEDRRAFTDALERVRQGEEMAPLELHLRLPTEKEHVLRVRMASVELDTQSTGVVVTAQDITEQKTLERFRDTFFRMLVHDLRSPLSAALMVVRELTEDADMPPEVMRELLRPLLPTLEHGLLIAQNILDIAKLQSGKFEMAPEVLAPAEVIGEALALVQASARQAGVRVEMEVLADVPIVADRVLLLRVLSNLLSNAVKFTPEGGQVRVRYRQEEGMSVIEVEDTGPGIAPEIKEHLFQSFRSLDRAQGTGLGLAFCRLAVEAMGGSIEAENRPEGGAQFRVRLPRVDG